MTSTFWTDGYRDAEQGLGYAPPEHSATGVYTAEYQRGFNAYWDELAAFRAEIRNEDRLSADYAT